MIKMFLEELILVFSHNYNIWIFIMDDVKLYLKLLNEFIEYSSKVLLLITWKGLGIDEFSLLLSPAASTIRNKLIFFTISLYLL